MSDIIEFDKIMVKGRSTTRIGSAGGEKIWVERLEVRAVGEVRVDG